MEAVNAGRAAAAGRRSASDSPPLLRSIRSRGLPGACLMTAPPTSAHRHRPDGPRLGRRSARAPRWTLPGCAARRGGAPGGLLRRRDDDPADGEHRRQRPQVSGTLPSRGGPPLYRASPRWAVLVPVHPENRGAPAPGFEGELGIEGAPTPPIVVRQRVEVPGAGATPSPSAVIARLTLGTCDDSPLPDGQFLLRLTGGGVDGPGRGEDDAGWSRERRCAGGCRRRRGGAWCPVR